jgi:PTH1 family peptidyl-tRNA hydrolase
MNNSGTAVQRFARFHRIPTTEIAVAYDDLTIDLGLIKVSVQGSAGGHNGVASLLEHVGDSFARFRLGIGPKQPPEITLADFVLGKFTPEQSALLSPLISSHIAGLELLLQRGIEPAMNQLNRRASQ